MNPDEYLDAIHLPDDAGEYAEGLLRILNRIPPRWGRWISCDKGWYPLIIKLDERLAEIIPDYELHQVKEKYGTLRYYIGLPELRPQCCIDIEEQRPYLGAINPRYFNGERTTQEQYELDTWFYETLLNHFNSGEHLLQSEELEPERERRRLLMETAHEIINEFERRSSETCEVCGVTGKTLVKNYWYKTLCTSCGTTLGYDEQYDDNDEGE